MSVLHITSQGVVPAGDSLTPLIEALERRRARLAAIPVAAMVAL